MSIFSLDWFKSERDKELELLKIEEQRLKNQLLQKMIDTPDLFKSNKHDESQNIKAISTSGNISIIMPDKKDRKVEITEEPKDVVPEKSSTIDEQLPRTIPSRDIAWRKEITKEGFEIETPILPSNLISSTIDESRPYDYLYTNQEMREGLVGVRYTDDMVPKDVYIAGMDPIPVVATPVIPKTIYKTAKLINNVINVILRDGTVLTKIGVNKEFFELVKAAKTEQEIRDIFIPQDQKAQKKVDELKKEEVKKEIEEVKAVLKGIDLLTTLPDFIVEGNTVCLKETKRSMPDLLVKEFSKVVGKYPELTQEGLHANNEYMALKNFFLWCCLNPRPEVADQLYTFLKKNSFRITKQGFFVALRNIVTIKDDNSSKDITDRDLLDFVTNAYNKVKAVWKKSPKNFIVSQNEDGSYKLSDYAGEGLFNGLGRLSDLYKEDVPKMPGNRFTDAHTRTFDIRIGQVVNMPPEKCSWSTIDCAEAGLHFTADQIHYVGCGDTSVLILINPMKVVGIGEHKGRCYEYLPIMTVPRNEATTLLHDLSFDTLELDEDYAIRELETLTKTSKTGFISESSKYKFSIPSVPVTEINSIFTSLKEMEQTLSKRISIIK